jgi:tRNA(Ile)-lysidine synthase
VLERVEETLDALEVVGARILVAISGGADSTVLAHSLSTLARPRRLEISLAHVNHGLRGPESDADEEAVAAFAERCGQPLYLRRLGSEAVRERREATTSRERPSWQEAARQLRAQALLAMRAEAGADYIATGHHADDQVETVLLRVLRGCSPDSLGGIPNISADRVRIRPLLQVSRAEIVAYAREAGLDWREDSSNRDEHYARNRLRSRWLPALARDFNPQLLRAIGNLAEAQQRDSEWLESLVAAEAERCFRRTPSCTEIAAEGWDGFPEALARRLVRRVLIEMGGGRDLSRVHLLRVLDFLRTARRPGATIQLPGGLRLRRGAEAFWLYADAPEGPIAPGSAAKRPASGPGVAGGRVLR